MDGTLVKENVKGKGGREKGEEKKTSKERVRIAE